MPSSGSVHGTVGGDGEFSYLDWQVASQDVANNRSLINWQAGWLFVTYSCRGLRQAVGVIDGNTVYSDTAAGDHVHAYNSGHEHRPGTGNLQTASGSLYIGHNSDGTKTISASMTMTGFSGQVSAGSGSFALPDIPRLNGAPSTPVLSEITADTIRVVWTDGVGGAPITNRQVGFGTDPNTPDDIVDVDNDEVFTDLEWGTTYYFWARTQNAAGNSPWSGRASATTLTGPESTDTPTISDVKQTSFVVSWVPPEGDGGSPITEYQVAVNDVDDPDTADLFSSPDSPRLITGLDPYTTYYVWVRAVNAIDTATWSSSTSDRTLAGARVNQSGVWKQAIPYVRAGGVWKVAQPFIKVVGVWKETS